MTSEPYANEGKSRRHPWRRSTWMSDIAPHIADTPLCDLRMVGSHNSGTYGITATSVFGPDAPSLLNPCRSSLMGSRLVQRIAQPIAVPWAICQSMSVLDQLRYGCRYLDLRVGPVRCAQGRWSLAITHTVASVPLDDVVTDIVMFASELRTAATRKNGDNQSCDSYSHSVAKEIIVVDLQKVILTSTGRTEVETYGDLLAALEPLRPLCLPTTLGPWSTLRELWAASQCPGRVAVLLCAHGLKSFPFAPPEYVHCRQSILRSPWHNANTSNRLLAHLCAEDSDSQETKVSQCYNRSALYISQAVLSPYVSDVALSTPFNYLPFLRQVVRAPLHLSIRDYSSEINSFALEWFRDANGVIMGDPCCVHSNILLLDYIEVGRCRWRFVDDEMVDSDALVDCVELCVYLNLAASIATMHR